MVASITAAGLVPISTRRLSRERPFRVNSSMKVRRADSLTAQWQTMSPVTGRR